MFKKRASHGLSLIAIVSISFCAGYAQSPSNDESIVVNNSVHALKIPAVPNAPFTALEELETSQALQDGTTVVRQLQAHVARDTQGRTHQESRYFHGPNGGSDSPIKAVVLYDPSTRARTILDPATRTVKTTIIAQRKDRPSYAAQESLGLSTIEGQSVEGTRYTRQIPAGAFGNDNLLVITEEIWFSPTLQVNILMKQFDPRFGTVTMKLTNIQAGEPAPEMFQLPEGYQVIGTSKDAQ
jgi:hypothetical protein